MVDPNPGRGMPPQLQRYWLAGRGAAKIRWNVPGDFKRCVRALRSKFPKNPEGLCNILHTKATGGPPGHGSAEHAIVAAAKALMDAQPELGDLWFGPIAPIGRPTGEPRRARMFEHGALSHRMLPLPLRFQKVSTDGHGGAVTVARMLGITYGPDKDGKDFAWAFGDWLNKDIVPEVTEARYLNDQGLLGPSVDPGGRVVASINPEDGTEHLSEYVIGGATLVPIPAFTGMRLTSYVDDDEFDLGDDEDMDIPLDFDDTPTINGCGCGGATYATDSGAYTFNVNPDGWKGLPLAGRNSTFDNDDAVLRIAAWAGVGTDQFDEAKLRRAFMWRDPSQPGTATQSYRLPVGDIINGQLTLVYHAVYAAAALISGAHGGLPNVPDEDKNHLKNVITGIYDVLAREFNDSSIRAPWSDEPGRQMAMTEFAVTEHGFPVAPPKEWFTDPNLPGKTPLTVTAEGRVFGHLAAWNECHRDVGARECVLAPKSRKGYAPFHLGQVETAEGEVMSVGKIVMDTRHASINLGYAAAAIHYDHTGDEVAVVRAGEDQYGIWVAGSVVPEADTRKVAKLRRSPLSGDWRAVDGNLELTAALAVNVPAFPVYAMEDDQRLALVAAGTVYPNEEIEAPVETNTTADVELSAEQDDRRWALWELIETEETFEQRRRAAELARVFAASSSTKSTGAESTSAPSTTSGSTGQPTGASASTAPQSSATTATGTAPSAAGAPTPDQAMAARQADTQFVILDDPAEDPANETPEEGGKEPVTHAEPAPASV